MEINFKKIKREDEQAISDEVFLSPCKYTAWAGGSLTAFHVPLPQPGTGQDRDQPGQTSPEHQVVAKAGTGA